MSTKITFRVEEDGFLPVKATEGASGYDLKAHKILQRQDVESFAMVKSANRDFKNQHVLPARERILIGTGVHVTHIPNGYELQIRPRSGVSLKYGLTVLNSPGTIDADYRGEIGVILYNASDDQIILNKGNRIAQMVVAQVADIAIEENNNITETERDSQGYGSTGR